MRAWTLLGLLLATLSGVGRAGGDGGGLSIALARTGEVVLADRDISAYILDEHKIVLSNAGLERWSSLIPRDSSFAPPIPQLAGSLMGEEFILSVNGVEAYRGHFWSFTKSMIQPGVQILETLGAIDGKLLVRWESALGEGVEDPRSSELVVSYFRAQGKLK